ncbi:DNA polymerase II large subunit [Candidatus Woesearchaeota archaeon]|nr:DNA polymerase II large subunit [Candidatus Woesearchaeota archaeon]
MGDIAMSKDIESYFKQIQKEVDKAYDKAASARKKGIDPESKIDIPLAKNMAERVEGLISDQAPQIVGSGIIKRINQLEKEYGILDWRVGFKIAEEVAKEKFCKFRDKKEAMEIGIRVGFAYLTIGIVSAPLEGFVELRTKQRIDGKGEYFSIFYSGPIRGAGGTAAATSVILADYVRVKLGYEKYDPTENEIKRYITELDDYHERVTNLQYKPSPEEVRFMTSNVPVEINGDPTEQMEVSNYKDLPRVETPRIRGGVCLVIGEGLCQKIPKIWKRISAWGKEFGLEWGFLDDFLKLQKKIKAKQETGSLKEEKKHIAPNYTFINDLVAGRHILTHPMREGGFRLRYGRTRTSGFSAAAIHPATMQLLNNYIAVATQLKVERPGKAAAMTVCDSIETPVVKLEDGSVIKIKDEQHAKELKDKVTEILFLGDILFNYGDFSENGHILVPAGYCEEWWAQELEKATVNLFGSLDLEKLSNLVDIKPEDIERIIKNPQVKLSSEAAVKLAEKTSTPLHPGHTYFWNSLKPEELSLLFREIMKSTIDIEDNKIKKIVMQGKPELKKILEKLCIPHLLVSKAYLVIEKHEATALAYTLALHKENKPEDLEKFIKKNTKLTTVEVINKFFSINLRDKGGTYIGARMGRPEKSKMRKLTGSPHVLFPVGEQGGRLRCFQSAVEAGKVRADFPINKCAKCNKNTIYRVCEDCSKQTKKLYYCKVCGAIESPECGKHGKASTFTTQEIDIKHYFNSALKAIDSKTFPDLIKGVRGTSNKDHIPEHLGKAILRASHDVYVNKDGTTRYDMSEIPITHFKPKEIGTEIERLKKLGYTKDIKGKDIINENQIIEIFPQDIIPPSPEYTLDETADECLVNVAKFIDDELTLLYKQDPYYNIKTKEDLIGHLVIGLAPHISAGMIGRIIGFSKVNGCFAHPMWHAGVRRDCDGDEACVILLMDALLNFSRQYLPDKRGSRSMDSPLVLTSKLIPSEVDDQAHGIDVQWKYPLEFYESALNYTAPWEVKIEKLKDRIGTELQYQNFGFTHNVSNINNGVTLSAYKTLPSMEEKLKGQMEIAEKIRAVDESDVARLVIEKHFIKDTKGNLRKFSNQEFRCVACNEKFRRPPLIGKCTRCGGKIIFTISEGSVVKYLEPSISLAKKYNVPAYLQQSLELLKRRVEDVFGKEKEKQEGLGKWFG